MAGEGLFFTGTVLENNRNLLEEEAARQQLEMQREQLELQKQAAADKRKDARKKNDYKSKDYTPEGLNPFFIDNVVSKTSDYKKYVDKNSQEYDNDSSIRSNIVDMEGGLTSYISKAKNISSILTSYDTLVKQGKGDSLAVSEDGSYLYEYNFNKIQEATSGENAISLDEALELYPLDSGTTVNKTPYKNPINALYDAKGSKMTTITNADGSQYRTLGDISKESENVVAGLTPDKNGNWDNADMEKLYLGIEGTIESEGMDGNVSFPAAFAFETRGIDIAGSTTFTDKLNPKNPDTYDPELANEYIQFIKNKSEEKAKRNNPNQSIKAKPEDKDDDTGLSDDSSKILLGDSEKTKSFGEVNIKFSPNQYDDLTNENITVSLSPEALIEGQGAARLEEFNTSLQVWNSDNTGMDAQGKIIYTGITESNQPVAAVEFSGQMYLIPLASLSSSVKKKIKTAGGTSLDLFKIAEGGVTTESSTGVGSKYNKPT
tara:strand:- start:1416 stop:2882 length:1467 start_codon:yes stop_codon:yes gene_type:complete